MSLTSSICIRGHPLKLTTSKQNPSSSRPCCHGHPACLAAFPILMSTPLSGCLELLLDSSFSVVQSISQSRQPYILAKSKLIHFSPPPESASLIRILTLMTQRVTHFLAQFSLGLLAAGAPLKTCQLRSSFCPQTTGLLLSCLE